MYFLHQGKSERGLEMREADAGAGAESRWAKAASRAEGLTDVGIGGAVRRYFWVYFPLTVLAGLVVGFTLASLWPEFAEGFLQSGCISARFWAGSVFLLLAGSMGTRKCPPWFGPAESESRWA